MRNWMYRQGKELSTRDVLVVTGYLGLLAVVIGGIVLGLINLLG